MREKRGVKETSVSCSDISVAREQTPIVNGFYCTESSRNSSVVSKTVSNRKLAKKWNAVMDFETYLSYRRNGSTSEYDLNSSDRTIPPFESFSAPSSGDSSQEHGIPAVGCTYNFYKRFASDYWNVLPKTDYTYSPSSLYYKKEIVPGVPVVPNLSRRPCRFSYGTPSSPPVSSPESIGKEAALCSSTPVSTNRVTHRRNASIYRRQWYRRSWIRRTYETVKTVIITTVTTSVTTTAEAVMHPMRKPCITFPLIFLLLALLFYILFYTETVTAMEDIETQPWVPLTSWLETQMSNSSTLAILGSVISKPFIWTYKIGSACLHLLTTCLFMIPTILSQLVQSMNTCFIIFFQRIAGWANQGPAVGALDGGTLKTPEKSSFDHNEIRKIVLEVLSERENEEAEDIREMKISTNDQVKALYEFVHRVSEKLTSLEDQKKVLDEIYPRLKLLEEQLSTSHLNLEQNGEVASREGKSNFTSVVGWPELSENVALVVKSMLKQYHADRTGLPDYALMSNGGTIISIRCTQTYTRDSGNIYLFGFPFWNVYSGPDVIIKPGIMPGECWAFEGSEGYVAISLAMPIYVTGFTMEHTPKELTPHGNIKSAPHQFSVWALKEIMDDTPQLLGRFKFLDNGESLQYFEAMKLEVPVQMIELRIESNHGSINYTCLYRFRVHGKPA